MSRFTSLIPLNIAGFGVWGVGCGVMGKWGNGEVGCRVWGVGCGVWGVGCGV
ncbi:hypothetical protein RVR34_02720 [Microcystis aeruginosa FBCC-A68]|uniref:hypothetical protein n=1 Tax=Microcystis aeruginosa TaxID=1126 RepID=UPI001482E3F9|nr:hypothetical protein [Microcystis aeruginosa]